MSRENEKILDDMNESDEFLRKVTEQLNTELQDIQVSEDLIQRTLSLAKQQKETSKIEVLRPLPDEKEPIRTGHVAKRPRTYLWGLASVAAVFLLFVLGGRVIGSIGMKSADKAESAMMSAPSMDKASESSDLEGPYITENKASGVQSEDRLGLNDTDSFQSLAKDSASEAVESMNGSFLDSAVCQAYADGCTSEDIKIFNQNSDPDKVADLMLLLTSDSVKLREQGSKEEDSYICDYYIVISMDNASAVLYQIKLNGTMKVFTYQEGTEPAEVTYQIDSIREFQQKLDDLLNS